MQVRYVSVTCEKIPLLDIEYVPPRSVISSSYLPYIWLILLVWNHLPTWLYDLYSTKTLKTVEASLRLDAIASAGFKISRSKMAGYIRYDSVSLIFSILCWELKRLAVQRSYSDCKAGGKWYHWTLCEDFFNSSFWGFFICCGLLQSGGWLFSSIERGLGSDFVFR